MSPYRSDLVLRDFLVGVTSNTPFYRNLKDEDAVLNHHALYAQLLNAINRENRENELSQLHSVQLFASTAAKENYSCILLGI